MAVITLSIRDLLVRRPWPGACQDISVYSRQGYYKYYTLRKLSDRKPMKLLVSTGFQWICSGPMLDVGLWFYLFMVELTIYWCQMHQPSLQPKTTRPQNPFTLSGTGIRTISLRSIVFFGVKIKAWVYPLLEEICLHLYIYFMFILACGGCLVFYCVWKRRKSRSCQVFYDSRQSFFHPKSRRKFLICYHTHTIHVWYISLHLP